MSVVAVLLTDLVGGPVLHPRRLLAPEAASLIARAVDTLAGLHEVGRVLVALPAGSRSPGASLLLPLRGGPMTTLEDAISEAGDSDFLVIHDPCRSTVVADGFTRMTQALRAGECAAVVAAVPVTDTLKEVDAERRIVGTVDRGATWELRTPHGYRLDALAGALAKARTEGITDAMVQADPSLLPGLVEEPVRIVPTSRESLPDDALAGHDGSSSIASTRRRSAG